MASNNSFKMEACLGVEREVNKVLDKFVSLKSCNDKNLSEIQLLLRSAKNEIQYEGKNHLTFNSILNYTFRNIVMVLNKVQLYKLKEYTYSYFLSRET